MPRTTIRLQTLKLDASFTQKMDDALQTSIRVSARAWLRAVVVGIPVWSGEARGSVKYATGPNGSLASYLNVSVPIDPKKATRKKNEHTGEARYSFAAFRRQYGFYFRSDVPHYIYNEFFPRTDAGAANQQIEAPWQSLQLGADAFNNTLKDRISLLPDIGSFMVKHVVPIPGT